MGSSFLTYGVDEVLKANLSFTRLFQLGTFVVFVWWAAVIKSVSAIFAFIFGPDYRQAMYGKNIKKSKFLLNNGIIVTNHGSYGTVPKKVLEARLTSQVLHCMI